MAKSIRAAVHRHITPKPCHGVVTDAARDQMLERRAQITDLDHLWRSGRCVSGVHRRAPCVAAIIDRATGVRSNAEGLRRHPVGANAIRYHRTARRQDTPVLAPQPPPATITRRARDPGRWERVDSVQRTGTVPSPTLPNHREELTLEGHQPCSRRSLARSTSSLLKLCFVAPPVGFEPTTHGLGNRCSIP